MSRTLLGCVAAAAWALVALRASAAELFPYNPPPASALQSRPQAQQAAPETLSADELRAIDRLATRTNQLPREQKRQVRSEVVNSLNDAVRRRDWHQAAYYTELLRRLPDTQ